MKVGSYVLHIYCDLEEHVPGSNKMGEFIGKNETEALRSARSSGWLTNISGDICPVCQLKWAKQEKATEG